MSKFRLDWQWRRIIMQATLWLVLGALVGLAALITFEKRRSLRLPLDTSRAYGLLRVRLPLHWPAHSALRPEEGDGVEADEPELQGGRQLAIFRHNTAPWIAPLEHLILKHMVSAQDFARSSNRAEPPHIETLDLAGWPGTLVTQSFARHGEVRKELLACAVLPHCQALVVRLSGPGLPDPADEQLVHQMAETLGVADQIAPGPAGGELALGKLIPDLEPIVLNVPPGFRSIPGDDPNRLSRVLLDASGAWMSVELIPCVFFADDSVETIQTMLCARDRSWQGAALHEAGVRCWRADKPGTNDFPQAAYLLFNGQDQALLAIFHGDWHDARRFDAVWQALAPTVRFAAAGDVGQMLRNGAAETQRLAQVGLDKLLPAPTRQRWLRWSEHENSGEVFWMQSRWAWPAPEGSAAALGDGFRTLCPPDAYATDAGRSAFDRSFRVNADWSFYRTTLIEGRVDAHGEKIGATETTLSSDVLQGGRLGRELPPSRAAPRVPPPQFVPGGCLPDLLACFGDKPMILRCESFVDCEGAVLPGLLSLLVVRATDVPDKLDEAAQPMTCWCVGVNGTGRLTRWYFDHENNLRYIDMPDGLRAARTWSSR